MPRPSICFSTAAAFSAGCERAGFGAGAPLPRSALLTSPICRTRPPIFIRPSATRNIALDRPITDEKINGNYNNFYEFGSPKTIADQAQELRSRPWTVKIDGMVEKPMEIGIDDLIRKMTLEERTYRHRCVEAWSMAIAWTGFPVRKLVDISCVPACTYWPTRSVRAPTVPSTGAVICV